MSLDQQDTATEGGAPQEAADLNAVPPQEVTATPAEGDASPDSPKPEKTFTQQEVDEIVQRRLAKEQRKQQRLAAVPASTSSSAPSSLSIDQFDTPEAYAEALAAEKAERLVQQRAAEAEQRKTIEAYQEREEEAREKYSDFEQVAYNPSLPITEVMAQTIRVSEVGPEVLYHLGQNPKEAARIAKLAPFLQAKEIGRIEAKLADAPPAPRKVSSAPAPIRPASTDTRSAPVYDTTDPRSVQSMSTSEWIEAERKRQIRRMQQAS